jgi:hypothetical protein
VPITRQTAWQRRAGSFPKELAMAADKTGLKKEIERLDALEKAAWKSFEGSKNEADAVRFLNVVYDAICKRCQIIGIDDPAVQSSN